MDLRRILQQNKRAARGQSEGTHHAEERGKAVTGNGRFGYVTEEVDRSTAKF